MGVKYTLSYRAYEDTQWRVDFIFPDYEGAITTLRGVQNNACTFSFEGGTDDVFDAPIIATKATIQVYNQSDNIDVSELQNLQDLDVKVQAYREEELKWVGYLVSDGIQKPMKSEEKYAITLTATDGLKLMSDKPYAHSNLPAPTGAANRCPLNFLRSALGATGNLNILLPIRWHIDMECVAYPGEDVFAGSVQWSPRGEGFTDSNRSVLYIIENIVKSFGCQIFQWDGAWHVMRMSDVISGAFTYNEIDATLSTPTVTTHAVDIVRNIGADYPFILEDALQTVKPALKQVDVRYEHDQKENILPNGSMDTWVLGTLLSWGLAVNPDNEAELAEYISLNDRPGSSVQLTFPETTGGREAEFTMMVTSTAAKLPIESHILFKRMTLGFTFLPVYGFPYDTETGLIDWTTYPLQIRIGYTINVDGVSTEYFLNEFGFWVYKPESVDLTTDSYSHVILPDPSDRATTTYVFSGTPNPSISLRFTLTELSGPGTLDVTFAFVPGETLLEFFQRFADYLIQFSGIEFSDFSITDIGGGQVQFQYQAQELWIRGAEVFSIQDVGLIETNRIGIEIPNLQVNDIAAVEFNRRQEIIIPDPGVLDGTEPAGVGEMSVTFFVKEGQQYVLDDVWMRVDANNDVYRATIPTVKNSAKQTIDLKISSSFSGFMLSNYMTSFDASNEEFIFEDSQGYDGSLTELYARSVMNWRHLSSVIFNGTFNVRNKDWSFFEIYTVATLESRKFMPVRVQYNTERCEVNMIAMEGRNDDLPTLQIEHLASNDMPLSNFGG